MKQYKIDGFAVYEFTPARKIAVGSSDDEKQGHVAAMAALGHEAAELQRRRMERSDDRSFEEVSAPLNNFPVVFWGHANGVPSQVYRSLFEKMCNELNCIVISYDMRGMGQTEVSIHDVQNKNAWTWGILLQDHIDLFLKIKKQKKDVTKWIFAGHSLGAWLSLLSAHQLKIKSPLLFEPAVLLPDVAFRWFFMHLLRKTHLSPMSGRVKKRRRQYSSYDELFKSLKKSSFMKMWSDEVIEDYIKACYVKSKKNNEEFILRHDPHWEGTLFEKYPAAASLGFLKIPFSTRLKIKPVFIAGEKSDTCNPKAKNWVKLFFPKLSWIVVPKASHMFPLEMPNETIEIFKNIINVNAD